MKTKEVEMSQEKLQIPRTPYLSIGPIDLSNVDSD